MTDAGPHSCLFVLSETTYCTKSDCFTKTFFIIFMITTLPPPEELLYNLFPFSEVVLDPSLTALLQSVSHNPDRYKQAELC